MASTVQPSIVRQPSSSHEHVDRALGDLRQGAARLAASDLDERMGWARDCIEGVSRIAVDWVNAACRAKQIPETSPARAEEVLAGPISVLRFLQLTICTLRDVQIRGVPRLPGKPRLLHGQVRVPIFPTSELYDTLIFRPLSGESWLEPGVSLDAIFGDTPARLTRQTRPTAQIALVLGAGNVSAIPATDALTKILHDDCVVLLKMNPVNDYLGPLFEQAFQPLIRSGLLRIVYGGVDVGSYAVHHPQIETIHITGSIDTHDAIVWGADVQQRQQRMANRELQVTKPVTSELGNVSPWTIVPGVYSPSQLRSQAEGIAASITNNASFNCVATKLLITWKQWPQRERFLDQIAAILAKIPLRYAYYPGAEQRFAEFAGGIAKQDARGRLPWTLRRDVDPHRDAHLLERESFVCVTAETALEAASPQEFLERAVQFMNERTWGTLAAALTVPDVMQKRNAAELDAALRHLRYGTIGINLWPGVAYALMSPPWGAYPGAELSDVQSGLGFVHNTYLLERPQKTVLKSPLSMFPKPVWFSTHRRPESVAWRLCELYGRPSWWRLPAVLTHALRG